MVYNIDTFNTIILYVFSYDKMDYIQHIYRKVDNKYVDERYQLYSIKDLESYINGLSLQYDTISEINKSVLSLYLQ